MKITAKRTDGKIVTLRPGEAVCGFGFYWVKITGRPNTRDSGVQGAAFQSWFNNVLFNRLMDEPKRK